MTKIKIFGAGKGRIMKAEVEITDDMAIAHALCDDKTDCDGCPCLLGTVDCIYNYVVEN